MLDRSRNRTGWTHLVEYYRGAGDTRTADEVNSFWNLRFPEYGMLDRGSKLGREGATNDAMKVFRRIVDLNPGFAPAYANIGYLYYLDEQYDSAITYLNIADAMQPRNTAILHNLAAALDADGQSERAADIRRRISGLTN